MKRVSSRRRLVSWDAFDATERESSEECEGLFSSWEQQAKEDRKDIDFATAPPYGALATTIFDPQPEHENLCPHFPGGKDDCANANVASTAKRVFSIETDPRWKRKREEPPASVPILPKAENRERMTPDVKAKSKEESLPMLHDDIQWHMISFLDVETAARMIRVNRRYHNLLTSKVATSSLWKEFCVREWPWLGHTNESRDQKQYTKTKLEFVDSMHEKLSDQNQGEKLDGQRSSLNMALLLRLASKKSTIVDETIFIPDRPSRGSRRFIRSRRSTSSSSTMPIELKAIKVPSRMPSFTRAVQFIGSIGQGDRCIRADYALPRPELLTHRQHQLALAMFNRMNGSSSSSSSSSSSVSSASTLSQSSRSFSARARQGLWNRRSFFLNCLGRPSSAVVFDPSPPTHDGPIWRPFVAPFLGRQQRGMANELRRGELPNNVECPVQLTPRLVSYFEVTILSSDAVPAAEKTAQGPQPTLSSRGRLVPDAPQPSRRRVSARRNADGNEEAEDEECVAVGLASSDFELHTRMPGWDNSSFGYHGDDGGIFHGRGHMIRPFGPRYGAGDTVGCGLDYHRRAIFYTLNGRFLGYAFDDLPVTSVLMKDWYPVVGLDTHCPVVCNFGTNQEFMYDLTAMIQQQRDVIIPAVNV